MKCDIIIPIWDQLELTKTCIEYITRNTYFPYRLILVDNGSNQKMRDYLDNLRNKKTTEIDFIRNENNLGFIKAVNQGLKISKTPYVCIMNNDTMPGKNWLNELVDFAETHPDAGLLNPVCNGHSEKNLTVNGYSKELSAENKGRYMEMNQCQGFCMFIKRELIDKIGYLDEKFGIGGFDDTDYSMRAYLAGYKSVCVHSAYVYHREHKSFDRLGDRKNIQSTGEREYFKKWPRHLRIALVFSVTKDTPGEEIRNFLDSALYLARKWCWVNLLISGGKNARNKINTVSSQSSFPVHQNIKFNYLNKGPKIFEIAVRILERSFGRKRRKKYDAVISDGKKLLPFLKVLCDFQKCDVLSIDFKTKEDIMTLEKYLARKQRSMQPEDTKCDIILPVCDQYEFTKKCIESIIKKTDTPYRLIVINNGKNPDTKSFLDRLERKEGVETTIVHNNHNIGWVKALNKGMEISRAPYVCFQNDDTIVTDGWLRKMINILKSNENFGMINPTWEGRPPNASIDRYNSMLEGNNEKFVETDWCRGFSVVIKRRVIEKIGKVDEVYGLAYFDDVDYSVTAIEAGFLCLRALDTYVYHYRNVTFFEVLKGKKWNELHEKNKLIYYKKWGRPLKIVVILNMDVCRSRRALSEIEEAVFYLARKQHHVNIWSPLRMKDRFKHTNVKMKFYHPLLLNFLTRLDLNMNKKKKPGKQYNAVFKCSSPQHDNLPEAMKKAVDNLKEKTKELVDAKL